RRTRHRRAPHPPPRLGEGQNCSWELPFVPVPPSGTRQSDAPSLDRRFSVVDRGVASVTVGERRRGGVTVAASQFPGHQLGGSSRSSSRRRCSLLTAKYSCSRLSNRGGSTGASASLWLTRSAAAEGRNCGSTPSAAYSSRTASASPTSSSKKRRCTLPSYAPPLAASPNVSNHGWRWSA